MGLLRNPLVGLADSLIHLARLRRGNGQLLGSLELGLGCGRDAQCSAGIGRRSHFTDCWVLSRAPGFDGSDGVGVGHDCMGGDEVLQACEYQW